jgi:uncharacterized repeat protein (TIGR02543 family)
MNAISSNTRTVAQFAAAVVCGLALAACGGGDDSTGSSTGGTAPFTLNVKVTGNGSVSDNQTPKQIDTCTANSGTCSGSYGGGANVTLVATPATGYTFTGWGGDCSGTASTVAVTMNASLNCTAAFATAGGTTVTPPPVDTSSNSYWTMDSYTYTSSVDSVQTHVGELYGSGMESFSVQTNSAYTAGGLDILFNRGSPGIYTVVPNLAVAMAAVPPGTTPPPMMQVGCGVGHNETGVSNYTASSGQVQVTQTSDGKYHYTSVGSLPTTKTTLNGVGNGLPGASQTMSLTLHNVY